MSAHFRERRLESILIDRLQEIVDRPGLKSANGILVVRGDKYDQWERLVGNLREEFETGDAGHLNVEKHQIRLVGADGGERVAGARALGDDFEVRRVT